MLVNHELAHTMIQALSMSDDGRELVHGLETIRYYHYDGDIAHLGYGATMVTSWERDSDDYYFYNGRVLLPGKRDKLSYASGAYKAEPVPGAIFWDLNDNCFIIPRVLGEWAAECIMRRSSNAPIGPSECRPAAYRVNSLPGMVVTAPVGEDMPGLTRDKWARKKAFQTHYERFTHFPSFVMPGYSQYCETIYGVQINAIDILADMSLEGYTAENLFERFDLAMPDLNSWFRATCQVLSEMKHWEYFNTCSALQCARHLVAKDFTPQDL